MIRRASVTALLLFAVAASGFLRQGAAELPRAETVVKPLAYVSLERVPRGRTFEVAVVAEILPGFHINANKVFEDYLIPTTVEMDMPKGFRLLETAYPKGLLRKFEFSEKKMSVYEGSVTMRLKLAAQADAPLGEAKLPLTLRYQACNDKACLPPVRKTLTVGFQVAPAGTSARPANPAIFGKKS
jgi:DsbC/DsbD-like thiol-disulfide interchange protein